MTTLGITPLIQNQLQFNLAVPPSLDNYAAYPRRPGPIVVEKLGVAAKSPQASPNPLRFSTISEEDMDVAVRLARRDLKKKRLEVEMDQYMEKMAQRASPKIDKKTEDRLKSRERLGIGSQTPKTVKQTQTKKSNRGKVVKPRSSRNERPHSPPTRDTEFHGPKLSQDERTAIEIRRLRKDLKTYVDEINRCDTRLGRPEPSNLLDDITDEEFYAKRKARILGRTTRSSRMVYDLKQQVRAIYQDIREMEPDAEPRKKSDVIKRLAAVHRATVRALQDLIHQIPEAGREETGRVSRELTTLINQLTECCQQLEIADTKDLEDASVTKLVRKNPAVASVWKEVAQGPIEFNKQIYRPYQPREPAKEDGEGYETDERAKTLRDGLENLIKARSPEKQQQREKPSVSVTFEQKPQTRESRPTSKGVLKNRSKKTKKPKIVKPNSVFERMEKPHYSEETIAHKIKTREAVQRQPSRSRSRSPKQSPRVIREEGIERLNLGIPNEWVEQAESAIRQRLEPMLRSAKKMSSAHQSPGSIRHLLSVKALDRIECNAGLMVDLLLEDLLKDTARELISLETEEMIENDAKSLMQGSELHTMLDRLELIEREQAEIRERWNSVRYNDVVEVPKIALSDRPSTPQPTTLKVEAQAKKAEGLASHPPRAKLEQSPIVFTNEPSYARLRSEKLDMLRHQAVKDEMGLTDIPPRAPTLTEDEVDAIHQYRSLKMIVHQKSEKTLGVVEKMSDEILDQLLQATAEEMMKSSSEMDNQLCMQELALGQNVLLSTDAENVVDDNPTIDERFPVNFDDDSCMDLHDMIHDDADNNERSFQHIERLTAGDEQRSFHGVETVNAFGSHSNLDVSHRGYHSDDNEELSYHDDRRQADRIRSELEQFDDVGHLESVVRDSGDDDENLESVDDDENLESVDDDDDDVEEEEESDRRAALLSNDVNDLQPIRTSQETEDITEEVGDVEYSSEFLTTTGEDSTR